ncbi:MAG: Ig-like domain-containing protein, partial [Hydrogenophaga sp.]|nr:Ig-like domain-containing protein [Hydrogenophaga sp.]
ENETSQTRLNQVFVVNETDRVLSFRLSNLTLDDVENAPDDAFEVALINAHTGASLLGGTGLTHNDAFFNLQANGAEHKAAQVSTQRLADGSILVVVELGGVPVGTVANLSFDLIGFGRGEAAASSRVTVSDLSLGMQLVATDDTAQVDEDGEVDIDVIGNDEGANRAGVEVVLVGVPAHGSVQRLANGQLRYKPDANWHGEDRFTYRLKEGMAQGSMESELATVTIVVTPVNDAPTIEPRTLTLLEDGEQVIDFLVGVSDVDGDALTVAIVNGPQHGTLEQQADGTFVYRPSADYHGFDAISFTVSDGTVNVPATLALVIESVNDAPTIAPRTLTLQEDGEQVIDFLTGVSDVDGDALAVTIVSGPQHGTLNQQADGTFVYRPATNYHGNDAISFSVSDGTVDVSATLALVVKSVNDAPVIESRTLTLLEDGEQVIDFLVGVSDVDGDTLTVTIVNGPQHGTLEQQADGTFVYRPAPNYHGNDAISFSVSDGTVDVPATLALVIESVNDAPVVPARTLTLLEDGELAIDFLVGVSDVDGDTLTVSIVSGPQHGTLEQPADGTFVYRPSADYHGFDAISFTVSDGTVDVPATLALVIESVND